MLPVRIHRGMILILRHSTLRTVSIFLEKLRCLIIKRLYKSAPLEELWQVSFS